MADNIQGPACSHQMILYFSQTDGNYTVGWWACKDCHTKFVPSGVLTHQQSLNAELDRKLGAARSFLKQLKARNNDGLDMDIWDRVVAAGLIPNHNADMPPVEEFDPARPIAAKDIDDR